MTKYQGSWQKSKQISAKLLKKLEISHFGLISTIWRHPPTHPRPSLHCQQIQLLNWESGWQSGRELDFYPNNPGSTPAPVSTTKKRNIKTDQCAFHDFESQGVLKKKFQLINNFKSEKNLVIKIYSIQVIPLIHILYLALEFVNHISLNEFHKMNNTFLIQRMNNFSWVDINYYLFFLSVVDEGLGKEFSKVIRILEWYPTEPFEWPLYTKTKKVIKIGNTVFCRMPVCHLPILQSICHSQFAIWAHSRFAMRGRAAPQA